MTFSRKINKLLSLSFIEITYGKILDVTLKVAVIKMSLPDFNLQLFN